MSDSEIARVPLTRGYFAVIDAADLDTVLNAGSWNASEKGDGHVYATSYARRGLHTFLTGYAITDHIDGCGLNNTRANLRPVTVSENMANQAISRANTSGYKGVSYLEGKWRAKIGGGDKGRSTETYLGYFDTRIEAALAYDDAARQRWGEFARLNFPRAGERSVARADYSQYRLAIAQAA